MAWTVRLRESVIQDLCRFGRRDGRLILKKAEEVLSSDPILETRNMKTLRPNRFAERELRLFGKYRVLFNVDAENEEATIVLVGEKRGTALLVQGEVFTEHHEDHPTQ